MRHSLSKSAGIALLIGVNIMWGLSFIFSKTALSEGIPSMTLVFLRYLITSALLVPACLHHERGIRLHAWAPRAFLTSMLGITIYYFFEYSGLQRTTASAASLIVALVPMMTLLCRVVFLRERVSPGRWGLVALSLLGVWLVIRADAQDGAGSLTGNLFMVCACLCWTGYIMVTPKLAASCSSLRITAWQSLAATVTLLPFALAERHAWVPLSAKAWLCIFLLAAVCSGLCYVLYNVSMRVVDPLTVALTININPITACVAGALLLRETLTPMQLAGGLFIMAAVLADAVLSARPGTENRA